MPDKSFLQYCALVCFVFLGTSITHMFVKLSFTDYILFSHVYICLIFPKMKIIDYSYVNQEVI